MAAGLSGSAHLDRRPAARRSSGGVVRSALILGKTLAPAFVQGSCPRRVCGPMRMTGWAADLPYAVEAQPFVVAPKTYVLAHDVYAEVRTSLANDRVRPVQQGASDSCMGAADREAVYITRVVPFTPEDRIAPEEGECSRYGSFVSNCHEQLTLSGRITTEVTIQASHQSHAKGDPMIRPRSDAALTIPALRPWKAALVRLRGGPRRRAR